MATDRIYTIGLDGRPVDIEMISAASDEEARAIAQTRLNKTDLESVDRHAARVQHPGRQGSLALELFLLLLGIVSELAPRFCHLQQTCPGVLVGDRLS